MNNEAMLKLMDADLSVKTLFVPKPDCESKDEQNISCCYGNSGLTTQICSVNIPNQTK